MEIKKNQIDDLNIELTLSVSNDDYADKRKKKLNDYRRKAEIKGFRKGMVPMSLVEKMYGESALVDSVNDVITESLNNYIKENSLSVLGEPLPSETQAEVEWTNGNDFEFAFDVALNPQLSFEVGKDDKITYYNIKIQDVAVKEMKENLLKQYGKLDDGEAAKEEDFLVVDLEQGETKIEGTYVSLRNVSEEAKKAQFIGLKPGDSIDVDVNAAFPNETDRASMLKVKKEELEGIDPIYKLTVKSVKTFVPAELNQATYDQIFGEGTVSSEEEFDAKVKERLAAEYKSNSDARFGKDAKAYLLEKSNVSLPEKFLKRWLKVANEGKYTEEDIEKEFPGFIEDFKWQTVRNYLVKKFNVEIGQADLKNEAKAFAAYQFAMYGMPNVPEEQLNSYADSLLANEDQLQRIYEYVAESKAINAVKENVTLKEKDITVEKFREL